MIEDGHVPQVFSATLAKVLHSLEFLNMSPAWVALDIGGGSVAAGAISSHRHGNTLASAPTLGRPQLYEHCHTLTSITSDLHTKDSTTDTWRLSSTSFSWVTIVTKPKFDHDRKHEVHALR